MFNNVTKVAIGIIGIGYEGYRGFISLLVIKEALRKEGVEIACVIVIEPDFNAREDCRKISKALLFPVKLFSSLDEFFYLGTKEKFLKDFLKECDCIIFYDASPTKYHVANLEKTLGEDLEKELGIRAYYLGEKPISTDKSYLNSWLEDPLKKFWCNFTEIQNSAYIALKKYLNETNFEISSLKFWRTSAIGLQKLINPEQRAGITGGALEDKGIHDIALTIDLLGGIGNIKKEKEEITKNNKTSVMVTCPEIKPVAEQVYFMPANLYALFRSTPLFINTRGEKTINEILKMEPTEDKKEQYWYFAADSEFKMEITWTLEEGRQVKARYYFSWAGLPEEVKDEIEKEISIKLPEDWHWLGKKEESVPISIPIIGGIRYILTEVRLMVVEGVNTKDHKNEKVICNLLRKPSLGIKNLWIYRIIQGENKGKPIDIKETEFQFSENFLARMFYNVILTSLNKNRFDDQVGKEPTCWAHMIVGEAREKAFKQMLGVAKLEEIESDPSKKLLIKQLSDKSIKKYEEIFLI